MLCGADGHDGRHLRCEIRLGTLVCTEGHAMRMGMLVLTAIAGVSGCSNASLPTKDWHTSPDADPRSSTLYPWVEWSVVEQLHAGMSADEARQLVHELQSYHHPLNAIVFTSRDGQRYEVALKLSKDKKMIEDISYKAEN